MEASSLLTALGPGPAVAVVRDGGRVVVAVEPDEVVVASGPDAFARLDGLRSGWWAGYLSYDLGRAVERVAPRTVDDLGLPDLVLARFPARLVLDGATGGAHLEGGGPGRRRLARALERVPGGAPGPVVLGPGRSSLGRSGYEAGVRTIIALIEAGDCYQVNLTRRLTWERPADPVALFARLQEVNPAPHAALLHLRGVGDAGDLAVVSASPERFLCWRGPAVETRPIKGTAADPAVLAGSAKDRAENVMIVDLARNDLGRVCEPGSVHVPALCELEAHPGLHHLVSTVRGRLRPGVGLGGLLSATFPPASVTGAPKPRVLQAIEDLEPVRRGVYCGAVGWIDADRGEGDLAVAIRTFTVLGGRTHLGVGAGIVADSDPAAEWAETELKAARLLAAASARPELATVGA
ncbi:MAG: anthranilate synthase component I family protein [Acidimicrobiia bacterium]|nr:anthranilate synthase component I family protein [Acidimicrobiia bacterium]